ncbi:hypothetical protein B0H11DRAFT_1339318 [Mycena galericulata]|nr:hypothetical protein B0H11DRAFT_1339318 [Mycena galericulata]
MINLFKAPMNCQFSFGPNRSYFCSAGSIYAWSALPAGLTRLLENRNHPQAVATPHDVAFPMEPGFYALCWKTTGGEDWYEDGCLGPNYVRLARFIKNVATKGGHTTRTTFGPGASFFSMSPSGYSWQNIPPALEDDIHNCMKIRRPTSVALGVQGTYVVLYNDGTVTFDLRGQYPLVEAMIRNTQEAARRRGVTYVALNPFVPGEYYAVYGDASASWNFPVAWTQDVTTISRQIQPVPIPAPAVLPGAASPGGVAPGGTAPGGTAATSVASVVVPVATGGTYAAPEVVSPPAQVTSTGGTGSSIMSSIGHVVQAVVQEVPQVVSSTSVGGTGSNIVSSIGHVVQSVVQEVAPPPPAYAVQAYVPATPVSPPPAAQSPPPPAPAPPATPPAAHKINWQEGLAMGLKAAEGLDKIIHVFEDQNQQGGGQQQQQGAGQQQQQGGLLGQIIAQEQNMFANAF